MAYVALLCAGGKADKFERRVAPLSPQSEE
jgi:hypothetical protein